MARHDPDFMNAARQSYFNVSGVNIDLQFGYFYDDEIYDVSEEFPYRPTLDKGIYIATEGMLMCQVCASWKVVVVLINKCYKIMICNVV